MSHSHGSRRPICQLTQSVSTNMNDPASAGGQETVKYDTTLVGEWVKAQAQACFPAEADRPEFNEAHCTVKDPMVRFKLFAKA